MSGTDDADGLDGPANVVALHRLVPAAEELDLMEELRADQHREIQELTVTAWPHPDWIEPPDAAIPGSDPQPTFPPSQNESVDVVDGCQPTHAQALRLIAYVLGGKPAPPEGPPPPTPDAPAAGPCQVPQSPQARRSGPERDEDADAQNAPRRPLSPHYWALRKVLDGAAVELVPTDRDPRPSQNDTDDDDDDDDV